jgi:hypothetical protein
VRRGRDSPSPCFFPAMGSRIKNFFLGKNDNNYNHNHNLTSKYHITNTSNPHFRGQSYNDVVALEPPLTGSYPVLGNGPNVVNEIQQAQKAQAQEARAKRLSKPGSISARSTASPHVVRRVDDAPIPARPRTAPGNGAAFGGGGGGVGGEQRGRTYSMKSRRMSVFSFHRQESLRSISAEPPPLPKPARDIPKYQPTGATTNGTGGIIPEGFIPPYSQQSRTSSRTSRKAYVDLLDAHSHITQSREQSRPRIKASGQRDYGEDVADRNITKHGKPDTRDSRLDINAPELSYLKSIYHERKGSLSLTMAGVEGSPSRAASALGHVLDTYDDTTPSTQCTPSTQTPRKKTPSIRSPSLSRLSTVFPPLRLDSRTHTDIVRGDASATTSNGTTVVPDARGRRMSPLATSTTSMTDEPPAQNPHRNSVGKSKRPASSSTRGRSPFRLKEPPPVPPPATVPRDTSIHSRQTSNISVPRLSTVPRATPVPSRQTSNTSAARESSRPEPRAMSATRESTVVAPTLKRSKFQRSSYSAFPHTNQTKEHNTGKTDSAVQRDSQIPSLNSVVDLTNTVDTDVTTKTLPGTYPPPSISVNSRLMSAVLRRSSNYIAPSLSLLHVSPHSIVEFPSFPP